MPPTTGHVDPQTATTADGLSAVSGWLLLALLAATIAAPFLLRPGAAGRPPAGVAAARPRPYLQRMRPHYRLGLTVPALALVHAWPSMAGGQARTLNAVGLYLATGAFLLTVAQALLGNQLRTTGAAAAGRRRLRRTHLSVMVGIAVLTVGHIVLNGTG